MERIIEPRRQVAVDEQLLPQESHEIGQAARVKHFETPGMGIY